MDISEGLPIWTEQDFMAYALMYAAYADNQLKDEEYAAIEGQVGKEKAKYAKNLFDKLNKAERDELLIRCRERFIPTDGEMNALLDKMQYIFEADGRFCLLEKSARLYLERVLKK